MRKKTKNSQDFAPDQGPAPGSRAWEDLCRRCGRCCFEKEEVGGQVYYTRVPCEFLDLDSRCCRVYRERSRRRPGCVALTPALAARGYLPSDCPYVVDRQDYVAPLLADDPVVPNPGRRG